MGEKNGFWTPKNALRRVLQPPKRLGQAQAGKCAAIHPCRLAIELVAILGNWQT